MRGQWKSPQRGVATAPGKPKKPYYVTTPIFYVNAGKLHNCYGLSLANDWVYLAPHVGHMYTMIIADILKRWQVLLGNTDAQLLTGTDEHGMKVRGRSSARGIVVDSCD